MTHTIHSMPEPGLRPTPGQAAIVRKASASAQGAAPAAAPTCLGTRNRGLGLHEVSGAGWLLSACLLIAGLAAPVPDAQDLVEVSGVVRVVEVVAGGRQRAGGLVLQLAGDPARYESRAWINAGQSVNLATLGGARVQFHVRRFGAASAGPVATWGMVADGVVVQPVDDALRRERLPGRLLLPLLAAFVALLSLGQFLRERHAGMRMALPGQRAGA